VGICAALERGRFGSWQLETDMLPHSYVTAVQRAGGIALMVPVDDGLEQHADRVLDRLDALILAGGADVHPVSYGEPELDVPRDAAWSPSPVRDRSEMALGRRAIERGLPLLGICRGMQLLNVIRGGTLDQHIADAGEHSEAGAFVDHEVELTPGSLAAAAAGGQRVTVRSAHHQGVARLGGGLAVTGRSLPGGAIEAIEAEDGGFALGVLWHPERDPDSPVAAAVVEQARKQMTTSRGERR
jgi:putative glutamine amidotransferase